MQGLHLRNVACPECGFECNTATFEGTVKHRCVTDSCPVGWFDD